MRIAMLGLKGLPGTFGGVERHVEELGAALAARGHDVTAYVRRFYTPREIDVRGVHTRLLPTVHSKHLDATVHTFLGAFHAAFGPYDVVHFHAIGPASFGVITRLLGKPVVATIHRLDYLSNKWSTPAKWALRMAERATVRFANRVITVSQNMAERHRDAHTPVVHIPNGVGMPDPRPADIIKREWGLQGGDYVLYLGRISPEKGLHDLLAAWRDVPGDRRLVLAGGTSHTDQYVRDLTAAADARTLFVGYQQGSAQAELYHNAAAFVLPSYIEGLPVVLLEAWSYGLPCLVSDIEPCREVGGAPGERCRYFPPGDRAALAAQLTDLLADPQSAAMGQAARDHVLANYGWDQIAARVEEQYRLVVEGRR